MASKNIISKIENITGSSIDANLHITQVGLDSVKLVLLLNEIATEYGIDEKELTPWDFDSLNLWLESLEVKLLGAVQ